MRALTTQRKDRFMATADLTAARLRELLRYEPDTGSFYWIKSPTLRIPDGAPACNKGNSKGYISIRVDGKSYQAHRLAWLYVHGVWPAAFIDHINGVRADNRICNLREATAFDNQANSKLKRTNSTGFKGVYRHKASGLFHARLTERTTGKQRSLGYFKTAEEAHRAYCTAASVAYGAFANDGFG